ncbi:unnamed protein product [Clavelina lepadiformis]|uniref:Elongation of very long chain fatty acids protein n=1 Tax=Clavelina lepadiformis TaxID=159417 RepID=A0ABP0GV65_CLALP
MLFTEWIQEVYTSYLTAIYEMADPRTAEWLLVKSPLYPSLILLCYVYFCVNSRTLTARMPAYKLRPVLILYNLFMVILSSYMVVEFFLTAYLLNYTLTCQSMEYDSSALPMRMARVCWLYYFSKYLELFETVLFALRKKYNQITFLHVYHHCSIIFFWWLGMKYLAGGTCKNKLAYKNLLELKQHLFACFLPKLC